MSVVVLTHPGHHTAQDQRQRQPQHLPLEGLPQVDAASPADDVALKETHCVSRGASVEHLGLEALAEGMARADFLEQMTDSQ